MKLLLGIVIAVLTTIAVSERPRLALDSMGWSTFTSLPGPFFQVTTAKDLLVYGDYTNAGAKRGTPAPGNSPVMSVRRRNSEGVYVPIGNFTQYATVSASTNGKWVALQSMGMMMFSVDKNNNNISEPSYIYSYGGFLLSDDTFVGYDPSPREDGNFTFRTYQYEASNNTWNNIPGTEVNVTTGVMIMGDYSSFRASDTHLVFADLTNNSNIQIYSRQADKSWKFEESVSVNGSFTPSINFNGVDTLVLSNYSMAISSSSDIVFIYTKINGKWKEQVFTTADVGYSTGSFFGAATAFVDSNTLLVTAGLEGYTGNSEPNNVGKVLVMTRNSDGMWEAILDLMNPVGAGLWGLSVGVNDYEVVIPNFVIGSGPIVLTFYTAPLCFVQPINVTCADQQVSDCSQLNISSLYTINNAQCGAVSATLNGLGLVNNKAVQAQFSFSKTGGFVASCNATVTCPAPPVAVSQTPSKVSGTSALGVGFGIVALFLTATMLL